MANLMPVIFFGHGNPMNALSKNTYTEGWAAIGKAILPRPKAVLAVSAHWYVPACALTLHAAPPTIHDFGGFPKELYAVEYPAPGNPVLARQVKDLLAPLPVSLDESRGLDHGVWAVLCHVFPEANIPIVQLSIDEQQPPKFHYEIGKRLAVLRENRILVVGSGNIVHNLLAYRWGTPKSNPFDWAERFENQVRELLINGNDVPLINYDGLGHDALQSIPTPEHYLPLLYCLGLRRENEPISFPVEGIDGGSVSMLAVRIG